MAWIDDFVELSQSRVDERVREALWGRGVDDHQIDLFRLGYFSGELPDIELPDPFKKWLHGLNERLRDTFVLPLTNALGEQRGLQFRAVDRSRGGYLDYFLDESEPILFGLGQAMDSIWDTGEIWLVEGGFDLFPVQRVFPNVVSTLTARVTDQFLRLLRRLVKRIYLSYDRDKTGREACSKIVKLPDFEFIKDVEYPEVVKADGKKAKDPSDYWEAWGDEDFSSWCRLHRQGEGLSKGCLYRGVVGEQDRLVLYRSQWKIVQTLQPGQEWEAAYTVLDSALCKTKWKVERLEVGDTQEQREGLPPAELFGVKVSLLV